MAETTINENGISMRLCEICTKYEEFRTDFLSLFTNFPINKVIEYMWFTGYIETQFGKPDITIRFTDGSYFFIEVKTKYYTDIQPTQELGEIDPITLKKTGYVGLIENLGQKVEDSYGFLVDPYHPGFEEEKKNIGNDLVTVVKWNQVVTKLQNRIKQFEEEKNEEYYRYTFFLEEIQCNVDFLKAVIQNKDTKDSKGLRSEEINFLDKPNLFCKYSNFLEQLKTIYDTGLIEVPIISKENGLNHDVIITLFIDNIINNEKIKKKLKDDEDEKKGVTEEFKVKYNNKNQIINCLPNWGYYLKLVKYYKYNKKDCNMHQDSVFVGYTSTIMAENQIVVSYPDSNNENFNISNFPLSIAIYYNLIDFTKLSKTQSKNLNLKKDENNNKVYYCKDNEGWYYFPIDDLIEIGEPIPINGIKDRIKAIFSHFLPDDTRRINYGGKNEK